MDDMKRSILFLVFITAVVLSACSTVNTTNHKLPESEVYVFDDVSDMEEEIVDEPVVEEKPVIIKKTFYIVQVGAFSTKGRAERFKRENVSKLSYELQISYSSEVGLFVVQLPPFNTKTEAERIRNTLWKEKVFRDAFILSMEK